MTATRTKCILSVQPVGDGGGSEHALIRMIRQLAEDGWECHVAVPTVARLGDEYAAAGAVLHVVPMARHPDEIRRTPPTPLPVDDANDPLLSAEGQQTPGRVETSAFFAPAGRTPNDIVRSWRKRKLTCTASDPAALAGTIFAVVYFAGFTSVFFTISILWQEGLGRSALMTGLVIVPFSFGSLVSAANSDKLSARMGRMVLVTGCAMVGIGLALAALVVHLTAPVPDGWYLVGPLLFAGLGSGMVIAPNQDFVLAQVPRQEAGTASAILGTSQRLGSAIGIAVIGTVLFGTLHVHPVRNAVASAFTHSSELALLANVAILAVALILVLALPRRVPSRKA